MPRESPPEGSAKARFTLSAVILVPLLASLGMVAVACAPATPVPAVPPAATPASLGTSVIPTPAPVVSPPPGRTPVSTAIKTYMIPNLGTEKEGLDLRIGDTVVFSVAIRGLGLTVSVEDPGGQWAFPGKAIYAYGEETFSFAAKVDGRYTLVMQIGMGLGDAFVTVTTDIYRP